MVTNDFTILIDDREKQPYGFDSVDDSRIKTERLDVGDYTVEGFADTFAIERKTLDDLATSCGSQRERFENEIKRAQNLEDFAVIIEASAGELYDYADQSDCPNYFSDIHPNSLIGTIEKWPDKYRTLQFRFAHSRSNAETETLYQLDSWFANRILDS